VGVIIYLGLLSVFQPMKEFAESLNIFLNRLVCTDIMFYKFKT